LSPPAEVEESVDAVVEPVADDPEDDPTPKAPSMAAANEEVFDCPVGAAPVAELTAPAVADPMAWPTPIADIPEETVLAGIPVA
jgi:hypothetical protein